MTGFEAILSTVAVISSLIVSYLALRLSRTAGQDIERDPERVARFVEASPFHLLEDNDTSPPQSPP
jgi:hypothetical protein